jgi:CheY-like chemotaxis protein
VTGPVSGQAEIPKSEIAKSKIANLKFEIIDTGPGIAPEEIDKVFEAFGQTETGRQTQEGTGLGLPISRKFVQLMGGDMTVQSEVGCGTVFTFGIQCDVVDSGDSRQSFNQPQDRFRSDNQVLALEPGPRSADGKPAFSGPCRMLIADDKATHRQLLRTLLLDIGRPNSGSPLPEFELREAQNGQEAIDIWQSWKPHLIWMDLRMPVLNGYEAIRHIKSSPKGKHTVVIIMSASVVDEDRLAEIAAGYDGFLQKPFLEHEVFDLLHTHLGVRFVYEERESGARNIERGANIEVLTPEALAALPKEIANELKQAANIVDINTAMRCIEKIRPHNTALADALTVLVNGYRFDVLQKWFEHVGTI